MILSLGGVLEKNIDCEEYYLIDINVNYLVNMLKNKLNNKYIDIGYIDGANHSYYGKEDVLASEICGFLKKIY